MTPDRDTVDEWNAFAMSIKMNAPVQGFFTIYRDAHFLKLQFVIWSFERDTGEVDKLTFEHTICAGDWDRRHEIALKLVDALYHHEIREQLTFDGIRTFDPHL